MKETPANLLVQIRKKLQELINYYRGRFDLGIRYLGIFFDDIKMQKTGLGKKWGEEHVRITLAVYNEMRKKDPNVKMIFCPLPYGGPSVKLIIANRVISQGGEFVFSKKEEALEYLRIIKKKLPKEIFVFWTGAGVFSKEITAELADKYGSLIGRKPLIWDNDALSWCGWSKKKMQPLTGRSNDLHEHTSGYIANVAHQAVQEGRPTLPVLLSIAEYTWNPKNYDPEKALKKIFQYLAPVKSKELEKAWNIAVKVASLNHVTRKQARFNKDEIDQLIKSLKGAIRNKTFESRLINYLEKAKDTGRKKNVFINNKMKVVSMLPSATELLYAIGAFDKVVAVSEECDYPEEAISKPKAMKCILDLTNMDSGQIDEAIRKQMKEHGTLYTADEDLLNKLEPDLIITQELCDVCSITPMQFESVIANLQKKKFGTRIVSLNPNSLVDIMVDVERVGSIVGNADKANQVVVNMIQRIINVLRCSLHSRQRQKVLLLEWIDPPFSAGRWVPDMIKLAGGIPVLSDSGQKSTKLEWSDIEKAGPDIIVIAPCGYRPERTFNELDGAMSKIRSIKISAVTNSQIYVSDEYCFAKPGPRVVDGIESLHAIWCKNHDFKRQDHRLWKVTEDNSVEAFL